MTDVKTDELQKFLNIDHIRQHLIKVGLVCISKNKKMFFFRVRLN